MCLIKVYAADDLDEWQGAGEPVDAEVCSSFAGSERAHTLMEPAAPGMLQAAQLLHFCRFNKVWVYANRRALN